MEFDEYISEIPPDKKILNLADFISKKQDLTLQQKINQLRNIGIMYYGGVAITAAVMAKVHNILMNVKLTDQQKTNQLNNLGFHYVPEAATITPVTDTTATDATVTDNTTEGSGFPWKWVLIGGAGIAAIYFLKKK